ncbi:MAG: septal ring lytic transglycosylase RlpA family protein [Synechococcus sp.]
MAKIEAGKSARPVYTGVSRALHYIALRCHRGLNHPVRKQTHRARFATLGVLGVALSSIAAVGNASQSYMTGSLANIVGFSVVDPDERGQSDFSEAFTAILGPEIEVDTAIAADGSTRNQVLVNNTAVASFGEDDGDRARVIAERLTDLADLALLSADSTAPDTVNDMAVASVDGEVVFTVDSDTARWYGRTPEDLTVMWVNNLRIALDGSPLSETEANTYRNQFNSGPIDLEGLASWYGPYFYGRPTASGELFVPGSMTAAHKTLPLGTMLQVTSPDTGRTVVVRVNDRGPYIGPRILDLSETAARELGVHQMGVANVQIRILDSVPNS